MIKGEESKGLVALFRLVTQARLSEWGLHAGCSAMLAEAMDEYIVLLWLALKISSSIIVYIDTDYIPAHNLITTWNTGLDVTDKHCISLLPLSVPLVGLSHGLWAFL